MRKSLYPWHEDCLRRWFENDSRGIVNVVNGAGKTVLALAIIERLRKTCPDLRVYIVVPKTFLSVQWARALYEELNIARRDIGIFSGNRKDAPGRIFMIYVVNSARYAIARHIVSDFQTGKPVLLIADECHHYGTSENARIFGFMEFITNNDRYYSLGLSATPYSAHYKTVLVPALGSEIYRYGFGNALQEGIINPFTVFNIALSFHPGERADYDAYSESLRHAMRELKEKYPHLRSAAVGSFFTQLRSLAAANGEHAELAQVVQLLLFRRKDVIYRAQERIGCVLNLIGHLPAPAKIIIFTERIETSEIIYTTLKTTLNCGAGLYHSVMAENVRNNALRRFEDGEIRILVSCKALDEGFNVPEADVGIIVSCTNSDRQRIQRLGRILRRKGEHNALRLYYLYIEDSAEEVTLLHVLNEGMTGVPVVEMAYREAEGFIHPYYDELTAEAMADIHNRDWDEDQIREFYRNIEMGRIACDWLLTEPACRERIDLAETRAERNYYVTMLLLIKARLTLADRGNIPL